MTGVFLSVPRYHWWAPFVTSIFLYACESWTLTAEHQRRIQAMEIRCYCTILHISYKDHVTNEEVYAKIQQAIWPHVDLLTIVDTNWSSMDMPSIHQIWPKLSCKAPWKGEEDKAGRKKGWKTTSGNGQARSSRSPRRHWRTEKNGGNWLWSHLWCPNGLHVYGISGDEGVQNVCLCEHVR